MPIYSSKGPAQLLLPARRDRHPFHLSTAATESPTMTAEMLSSRHGLGVVNEIFRANGERETHSHLCYTVVAWNGSVSSHHLWGE